MVSNREKNQGVPRHASIWPCELSKPAKKIQRAAEIYKMNHVNLSRYIQTKKAGRELKISYEPASRVFSEGEEGVLEAYLLEAADAFFGLTPLGVRTMGYDWVTARKAKIPQTWAEKRRAGVG